MMIYQQVNLVRPQSQLDALEQAHARLTMQVQLIWGADDPTFPVYLARKMVKQFPDARLLEIPGARLLVHEEKPAEVVSAALEFLQAGG